MDPYIGEIRMFAGNFAPVDWAFCNGQTMNIQQYTTLYAVIGIQFGGNGTTNFMLPNLQGKTALGVGTGVGLSNYNVGDTSNVASYALDNTTLPSHTHSLNGTAAAPSEFSPANGYVGTPGGRSPVSKFSDDITRITNNIFDPQTISLSGNASPSGVSNLQPYLPVNFIICLYGNFPPHP